MSSHTSYSVRNNPSRFVPLFLIFLVINCFGVNQQHHQARQLECLLEQSITDQCIAALNIESIITSQAQTAVYLCPVFVKFYQENQKSRPSIYQKVEKICKVSTEIEKDNGYTLFGLYLMKNDLIQALKIEYKLFFNQPFSHEHRLKETIQKYGRYLKQEETITNENSSQIQSIISKFYLGKFAQSLKQIKQLQLNKLNLDDVQLKTFLTFLKVRLMQIGNQFPDALSTLNNFIRQNKQVHWYAYHLRGNLLMHHIKFKEAIDAFDNSIKAKGMQRQFAFSYYNIGLCYQKINQYKKSLGYLKRVLALNPDSKEAANSLGFSYASLIDDKINEKNKQQYVKLAETYYKKSIADDSNYYIAYYNYGMLKFDIGDYKHAIQLLKQSLKINSGQSNKSSKYGLFKAMYKMDKQSALKYLQQNILNAQNSSPFQIGVLFYQLGELKQALTYLQQASKLKANLGEVYQWKGIIQFQLESYEQANASFRKALESGNNKPSIWFNLGYIQQVNKNYEKAIGLYRKSLQKDSSGPGKQRIQIINQLLEKKKPVNKQQL